MHCARRDLIAATYADSGLVAVDNSDLHLRGTHVHPDENAGATTGLSMADASEQAQRKRLAATLPPVAG